MASSQVKSGVPVYTKCQLQNHAGKAQFVTLDSQKDWHGSGNAPKTIQDQAPGDFTHNADSAGSIGGVVYVLSNEIKWVVAWSNKEQQPNKVYTQIFKASDEVDWQQIADNLDQSSQQSSDLGKLGYSSEAVIDKNNPAPLLKATLRPAA
ncbi:uncharacterized protein LOC110428444 [Herrania umbratica]|uniref:Uncharacterized protein LOC110428444 n=1 Tax=Herrania umbratica TaxID=108875 RepID=A0A6J1BNU4_9ROSI|nr:uncharacterized protein LOC110428444 [Herrania umbratica]